MTSLGNSFLSLQRGLDDVASSRWRGPAVPFQNAPAGAFDPKGTRAVILSSVINILLTPLGRRIWHPEFGSRLPELVFDPNDDLTLSLARTYIFDALDRWEPRLRMISTDVFRDQFREEVLIARLRYSILNDSLIDSPTLSLANSVSGVTVEVLNT